MTSLLKLSNITLCTLGSEKYRPQNQKALDYSSQEIEWGAVKNIIVDNSNSIDQWNRAVIYDLHKHIDTEFAMFIHPDGFVVHPESWDDKWLNYDYIGAPWPLPTDHYSYRDDKGKLVRVGNSVSLRSKKIMELPTKLDLEWKIYYGNFNEDGFLCCHNRSILEENGVKFAPIEVAKYFSRENTMAENRNVVKPFAFHRHHYNNRDYPNFEEEV